MDTPKSQLPARLIRFLMIPVLLILFTGGCEYFIPNKPPYVEKITPADSSVYLAGQVVDFKVNAYDVDGSVVNVVFTAPNAPAFTDSESPYQYAWPTAGLQQGNYRVEIMAVDNKEEPYIISVPVRILGNMTADAGRDTTFTDSRTSYILAAAAPAYSQGTWTILSGTGGQISDIHNPNAILTGTACQSYSLRWTVSNGVSQVSDEVTVSFSYQPSTAVAGGDQVITDGRTSIVLQAVTPTAGTGRWRLSSGNAGTFSDVALPNATFTGQPCSSYVLIWTVSTPCAVSADTVQVRFEQFMSTPNAGPDQAYTDGRTMVTLTGNPPATGNGVWSVVSGQNGHFSSVNDPKAVFTGQLCQVYILRWTFASSCSSKTDDVTINLDHTPTAAIAGPDMTIDGPVQSVILAANNPAQGTGTWSVVSGAGGVFSDIHDPQSQFTGNGCQVYTLKWTISTLCRSSSDQVTVSFSDKPSDSYAGTDQNLTDGSVSTILNASPPAYGTGRWSIISGGNGSFSDETDPSAVFTGILCRTYVLRWTVSTACGSSFDEVTIVFNQVAVGADAGPDVRVSDGSLTVTLQGNVPHVGTTGTWSVISGQGGVLEDANSSGSRFTGVQGQIYILKWMFTSNCSENSDLVTIAFIANIDVFDPRDQKTYQAVKIGDQTWMAENLNYSISGSYSYDESSGNASTYGRLYDWTTANTVCPAGWHLPSDAEWRQLEVFLGMDPKVALLDWYRGDAEGGMLKAEGTLLWESPNAGATNITGFTALPGGYRSPTGVYGGIKTHAGFWSSTGNTSGKAIYRALHKDKDKVGRDFYDKGYGFSVRCVKN
jgi:uncharacterized protein (TIGR02145 family)